MGKLVLRSSFLLANGLCWVVSLVTLVYMTWSIVTIPNVLLSLLNSMVLPYFLVITTIITFATGFLGCIIGMRINGICLKMYLVSVCVLLTLDIVGIICVAVMYDQSSIVSEFWFGRDQDYRDEIQQEFQCCGLDNSYFEYQMDIPMSCFHNEDFTSFVTNQPSLTSSYNTTSIYSGRQNATSSQGTNQSWQNATTVHGTNRTVMSTYETTFMYSSRPNATTSYGTNRTENSAYETTVMYSGWQTATTSHESSQSGKSTYETTFMYSVGHNATTSHGTNQSVTSSNKTNQDVTYLFETNSPMTTASYIGTNLLLNEEACRDFITVDMDKRIAVILALLVLAVTIEIVGLITSSIILKKLQKREDTFPVDETLQHPPKPRQKYRFIRGPMDLGKEYLDTD